MTQETTAAGGAPRLKRQGMKLEAESRCISSVPLDAQPQQNVEETDLLIHLRSGKAMLR